LAIDVHYVEALFCTCSASDRHSLHLHEYACLLVLFFQDVSQTTTRNQLHCMRAYDQHD